MKESVELTTRGRYAVMALAELSRSYRDESEPIPLLKVADHCGISLSYLEQLIASLRRGGFVESYRGPGGGYRLAKNPSEIIIADVLKCTEEGNIPGKKTSVISESKIEETSASGSLSSSSTSDHVSTGELWSCVGEMLHASLSKVSLADVVEKRINDNPYLVKLFDLMS